MNEPLPDVPDLDRVTRLTVVDDSGLVYEKYGVRLNFSVQDDGRTLKVFVTARTPAEQAATRLEVQTGWERFFAAQRDRSVEATS